LPDKSEKLSHNDELIEFPEEDEINHINYLAEFREKVYPAYKKQGMTLFEAMSLWQLLNIKNAIHALVEKDDGRSYE
jgi:hypothetical protein